MKLQLPTRSSVGLLAALFVLVGHVSLAAASVSVDLQVDSANPQVGEPIRVRYSVSIQNESSAEVQALDFGGLEVMSDTSPPSMPMFFGGGFGGGGGMFAMTMNSAREYIVRAPRPGRYTIGNAKVVNTATGRVLGQHAAVTLDVGGVAPTPSTGATVVTSPEPTPQVDPDAPPAGDLSGAEYNPNAFLRAALDPPAPSLGQQAILRVWLYVAAGDANCEVTTEPSTLGFWSENLLPLAHDCAVHWTQQSVGGRYMSAGLIRKIALFPTQSGHLTIGGATANVEAVTNGFFGSVIQAQANSPELQIDVREPPPAGRPADYVPGTVGPVNLTATADRADPAVGETVTITARATSDGSLASAVIAPPANVDGIRIRNGESRARHDVDAGRARSILETEILVVPERPGTFDLGELRLPYWDPNTQHFGFAQAAIPRIEAHGAPLPAAESARHVDSQSELRPMIPDPSLRSHRSFPWRGRAALVAIVALPLWLALWAAAGRTARWASQRRKERADALRTDPDALVDAARDALRIDGAQAISLAGRALDRALARARQGASNGSTLLTPEVRRIVDEARVACDAARFGGADSEAESIVQRVDRAVRALEAEP